jgi:EpsI family protein
MKRIILASTLLALTIVVCFALPKPKYRSPDILSKLEVPLATANWRGVDVSGQLNSNDLRYNFISRIFARTYVNRYRQNVTFLILDAGNFHNPKVCFSGSGFKPKELTDTPLMVNGRTFKATTVFFEKGPRSSLVLYWICIDKKQVNWTGQKLIQLWYSLTNKQKTGLMVRLEVPAQPETIDIALKLAQEFVSDIAPAIPKDQAELVFGK